jgi:hypothetical protein
MSSFHNERYFPIRSSDDIDEGGDINLEKKAFLWTWLPVHRNRGNWNSKSCANLFFVFNALLSLVLFIVSICLLKKSNFVTDTEQPPYCEYPNYDFRPALTACISDDYSQAPLRDDGVVHSYNTHYKPDKIFQSSPSDEVDEAWNGWLRGNRLSSRF